jgi:sulfotransferase family protein
MWSGPRNVSTALMRSWESRGDASVTDEPLYAHYLLVTRRAHPGAAEVIGTCETDWRRVAAQLTGAIPDGRAVWYQKHMSHHLLPDIERDWLWSLEHAFLIRDPREMLPSLDAKLERPTLSDTGLPQQVELFEQVRRRTGRTPPVVDARDLLQHPRELLAKLCATLDLEFTDRMLRWTPGPRATDGIWAKHWYANVERSSGFEPYRAPRHPLPDHLRELYEECAPLYGALHEHRLTP